MNRTPAIRVTAMPADTNAYRDIFGWLLSLMDHVSTAAHASPSRVGGA